MRHGEEEQADFLRGHAAEAALAGLAGTFVFSWTDDWFTRGYQIDDWAFGITRRDRTPKASYRAVADVFGQHDNHQLLNPSQHMKFIDLFFSRLNRQKIRL